MQTSCRRSKTRRNPEAEGTAQRVPYHFVRRQRRSVAVNDGSRKQTGVSISISSLVFVYLRTANDDPSQVVEDKAQHRRYTRQNIEGTKHRAPGARNSSTQRRQLLWLLLLSALVDYVTDDLVSWSSVLSQVSLGTPPLISLLTISDQKHRSGSDWQRQSSIVGDWNLFK